MKKTDAQTNLSKTNGTSEKLRKSSFFSFRRFISVIRQSFLFRHSTLSVLLVLLLLIIVQAFVMIGLSDSFDSMISKLGVSWLNILRNNAYSGIIALGMCFVIVSGGIDLSVGSQLCACGAFLMFLIDPSKGLLASCGLSGVWLYVFAMILTMLFGAALGSVNGLLIAYGRIPPFIVTLGTMKIFRSVTQQFTKTFSPEVPSAFKQLTSLRIGGQILLPIFYWILAVIILLILFQKTTFGRNTVAIGSNEQAAHFAGIPIQKEKLKVYMLTGVMCSIAAILYVSRIGSMDFANAGSGFEMDAIASVVVGGTSMAGGVGTVGGTFFGALIMGSINNILNSVGIPTFLTEAVKGAIIIMTVLLQQKRKHAHI